MNVWSATYHPALLTCFYISASSFSYNRSGEKVKRYIRHLVVNDFSFKLILSTLLFVVPDVMLKNTEYTPNETNNHTTFGDLTTFKV